MADKKPKRIRVVHPDGRTGTIPESQLDQAIAAGFKQTFRRPTITGGRAPRVRTELGQPIGEAEFDVPMAGIGRFLREETPTAIGAGIGAALGIPGGPPGIIAGATIGGAAGEAGGQLLRRISPIGREVETSAEAAEQIGLSGALSGVGEGVIRLGARAVRPLLRRLSKTDDLPVPLLRSERTGGKIMGFLETVTEKSLPGAARFETFRKSQQQALANLGDLLSTRISARNISSQEAGELFAKEVAAAREIVRDISGKLYGEIDNIVRVRTIRQPTTITKPSALVDELGRPLTFEKRILEKVEVGGVSVSTNTIKKAAIPLLKEIRAESKLIPPEELSRVTKILEQLIKSPKKTSFKSIQDARSDLLRIIRKNKEVIGGKANRIISILENEVDTAMESAAKESNVPGLLEKVRKANKFWAKSLNDLNSKATRALLAKDKDEVVAAIFRRGSVDDIELVKRLVSRESFQDMKGRYLRDVLDDATKGELAPQLFPGVKDLPGLQGQQIQILEFKSLQRALEKQGQGRLAAIFDRPEEIKALGEFIEVAGRVGGGRAKGLVTSLIAWSTNGFIIYSGGGALLKGSLADLVPVGAFVIGLNVTARILANPEGVKLVTRALVANRGTVEGTKIAARLLVLSQREKIIRSEKPELKPKRLTLELTRL